MGGTKWGVETLGGSLASNTEPHAVVDKNKIVHVFYRTPSGGLGHDWHVPWESGWGVETLGGSLDSNAEPRAVVDKDGGINVFYRTPSGGLGHDWWEVGNTVWGVETLGGSLASEPHAIVEPDNTVHVFYRTPSGGLGHDWHVPWESGWGVETLGGSPASEPHAVVDTNGGINVFYRTPSGGLGHDWWEVGNTIWGVETLGGTLAARPPVSTTGGASSISNSGAKVEGTVNPEGSPTTYYFEYGTTTAYGSKQPVSAKEIGYGYAIVAVNETLSGLSAGTTYHYRLVAVSSEGTATGADKTFTTESTSIAGKLASMVVTEPFNGSSESLANFSSNWSALGWASGTAKGEDTTSGWRPVGVYPTVNGAFYNPTVSDTGPGIAAVATMAANPSIESRYFSLWLDMSSPAGAKAGYELRFTDVSSGIYNVTLSKWQAGAQTILASKSSYAFANGNSFALLDQGGTVSAWTDTGSGFAQLLSAADASFASGNAGVEGAGNITRLTNFKVGALLSPVANMDAALKSLPVNDAFSTDESPLSGGGVWTALVWDNSTSGHNTGRVSGGWGPYDAYPTINGAYWQKASFADTGAGDAIAATLYGNPTIASRYFSLWLDAPSPATARSGYELRFTETSSGIYEVALSRWQSGTKTVLASKSSYSFPNGSQFALVGKAGAVSAWAKTGSEYIQLLSAADTTFISGYTGIEGSGNITRLKEFRSGQLAPF